MNCPQPSTPGLCCLHARLPAPRLFPGSPPPTAAWIFPRRTRASEQPLLHGTFAWPQLPVHFHSWSTTAIDAQKESPTHSRGSANAGWILRCLDGRVGVLGTKAPGNIQVSLSNQRGSTKCLQEGENVSARTGPHPSQPRKLSIPASLRWEQTRSVQNHNVTQALHLNTWIRDGGGGVQVTANSEVSGFSRRGTGTATCSYLAPEHPSVLGGFPQSPRSRPRCCPSSPKPKWPPGPS